MRLVKQYKMTLPVYLRLKESIIYAVSNTERHSQLLSSLKELFRARINSVRRFELITTIGELLKVLEIRDVLSEDNVECLKEIALSLPNSKEILQKICDYEDNHVQREYDNYYVPAENIKSPQQESFITVSSSPFSRSMSETKKRRIFQTIIDEIGSSWRNLARNLKIRECDIDNIELESKNMTEKATKVLHTYEYKKADPDRWFFILCDALEKTRRKDLAKSIQNIMSMNI